MLVSPDLAGPVAPQGASRLVRGEKYDSAFLRQLIGANLRAAQRRCNAKTSRELLLLQIWVAGESARGTDLRQSDVDISSVNMSSKSLIACAPTEIPWVARRLLVHHPAGGLRAGSSDFYRPVLSLCPS
jgi:hypothetical protein